MQRNLQQISNQINKNGGSKKLNKIRKEFYKIQTWYMTCSVLEYFATFLFWVLKFEVNLFTILSQF